MNNKKVINQPIIITFDGLDGSGKQSQAKLLFEALIKNGYKVGTADFPQYNKWHSFLVRLYLKGIFSKDPTKVNPYIASIFYAIDRFFAYYRTLKKQFKDMDYIIFDRWTTANLIFQSTKASIKYGDYGHNKHVEKILSFIEKLEYGILRLPRPDMMIVNNVSVDRVIENMKSRKALDIHENATTQLRSYDMLQYLIKKYDWISIDCMKSPLEMKSMEDIHSVIYDKVLSFKRK